MAGGYLTPKAFSSYLFRGCASSKTFSITCALASPMQCFGNVAQDTCSSFSAYCRMIYPRPVLHQPLCLLPVFFFSCLLRFPFFQIWFTIFAPPPLLADLRHLWIHIAPQTFAAASYRTYFPHNTHQILHRCENFRLVTTSSGQTFLSLPEGTQQTSQSAPTLFTCLLLLT